jgi:dihydroflavonol-4-reductase
MKLFVTGGTGFLGRAVCEDLVKQGHEVHAMVRDERVTLLHGVHPVLSSLTDASQLAGHLKGCEAVVHMAGKVSRDGQDGPSMHEIHVGGTRTLLKAMHEAGVRKLVLASTSGTVAVNTMAGKLATEADTAPVEIIGRWPYYMSKFLQEKEVLAWDKEDKIEAIILNPTLLLGPGDERMSSTGDVLKILQGRLPALTKGTIAFVDVRDCAPAFSAALEKGRRGHRYLLNGTNMSLRTMVERVARAGDVSMPMFTLPDRWAKWSAKLIEGVYQSVDRIPPVDAVSVEMGCHHWGCLWKKASDELGFSPRDPQQTVFDTVRDLESRGVFRKR